MTEQEFIERRKEEIKSKSTRTVGEAVGELKYDVYRMAEFMGCVKSVYNKTQWIHFDGRLRSTAGNIKFIRGGFESIKINPKLPATDEGIDEYFNTIKHELAHGITRASDDDPEFIEYCVKHNIGLWHEIDEIGEDYKYQIVCPDCGRRYKKYKRLSGRAKWIDKYGKESGYHCSNRNCKSTNLKVVEL